MRPDKLLFAASLLIAFWSPLGFGLSGDTRQPIHIESDRAERNEKQNVIVYQGSVIIRQGSIRIESDTVSIYNKGERVDRIICLGDPARYEQRPDQSQAPIVAHAKTIEYSVSADSITLIGSARLEQEGATITGERIEYDLKNEVVKAKGDQTGQRRIQMVIPPEALKKGEETP